MRIWLLLLILGVGSYLTGVVLDGVALDEDSKLGHLLTSGTLDDRWIPFSTTQGKLSLFGLLDNQSFDFVVPLISFGQLAEDTQMMISHGSVSFGLASTIIDPDGIPGSKDDYFSDGITQCNFHSFDDVPVNTCILCTLTSIDENGEHIPVAQGKKDLPDGYHASDKVEILITTLESEGANDIDNVDGVIVQLCDNGLGCTADFWQQEQSLESWPTSISPDEKFKDVFNRKISDKADNQGSDKKPKKSLQNPTLLEVLSYSGTAKDDLRANAVAALLNAETLKNSFTYTSEEVILMTQQAIDDGQYETAKDLFATENELGCPYLV